MNSAHSFTEGMDVPETEYYLAVVTYRIPFRLFWLIPTYIYRQGELLVKAHSVKEAHKKVEKVKNYYTHGILKTL